MSAKARTTPVHILGHEYKIRSTESPEFVREVAIFVDKLMGEISSKMTTGTTSQIAVLAALNIAEELFRERRGEGNGVGTEVDERMRAVLVRLEEISETPSATEAASR